jgi:hypothetical protein
MPITPNSARAYHGLQATAEPTSEGTTGAFIIGPAQAVATLPDATHAVVLGFEVDSTQEIRVDMDTLAVTLFGSGVAQVETATAAGTIGTAGNATVTVTGDDITGSPLAISVAVASSDSAATWAEKVRTALNATAAITSLYTVGGASTSITLTRIAARYTDTTLNIALANGTCTGITAAPSSTNTTAGINPPKVWRIQGTSYDGDDYEGKDLPTFAKCYGYHIAVTAGSGEASFQSDDGGFSTVVRSTGSSQAYDQSGIESLAGLSYFTIESSSESYVKGRIALTLSE